MELFTLAGHTDWVNHAAWSSDGTRIVTASRDGTAKVWDARTGEELLTLSGHAGWVQHAAWSSDDARIITAGWDGIAKVWDGRTGEELRTLSGSGGSLYYAAWSSDDTRILTAGQDGSARIYFARIDDLIAFACTRTDRNLTQTEWERYIGRDVPYRQTCPDLLVGQ